GDGTSIILFGGDLGQGQATPGALASVENEATRAEACLPRGRIVRSNEVPKQALLKAWSQASAIYVAAHLERDPDVPLLSYFPMRCGVRPDRIEDGYLDLLDARSLNLTACRLAVLSSCASGEPYVNGGRAGPSMADALLDAGAAAVIHARWQVRDSI